MRVLVTGASGFIGRAVGANLSEHGYEVVGYDRHPKDVPGIPQMISGDILDAGLVHEAVLGCDGVIHLAGLLGTSELLENVRIIVSAIDANIHGALNVYEACLTQGKPVVQISPGNKTWPSVYPITKVCAERLGLALGQDAGLKIAVVRAMNVYGPHQKHTPVRKYIPNLIRWAFRGEPAEIYGDGEQVMDPIWVGDTAEVLRCALEYAANGGQPRVFEVGSGIGITANEMADMVWRAVRPGGGWMPKVHIAMRPGEPRHSVTVANPESLVPLGIVPDQDFLPLSEGLARTVAWYRAHPDVLGLDGVVVL